MLDKQDQMIHIQQDTVDEINGFRKDSSNYLETEFSDIKKKLQAIENALSCEGIRVKSGYDYFCQFFSQDFPQLPDHLSF